MIPLRDYNRSRAFPAVTVVLIVANLLVFLYQGYLSTQGAILNDGLPWQERGLTPPAFDPASYRLVQGGRGTLYPMAREDAFVAQYGLVPYEILQGVDLPPTLVFPIWLTLLTSMFLHGGLLHVLGNMLYLWVFGDNVEEAMGHGRFLIFYLLCGIVASFAQVLLDRGSAIPQIGASGAIAGVLAAYFFLFPFARILTLVPILFFVRVMAVPAVVLLGLWFLLQVGSGVGSLGETGGGVAWFAHIGGFLAGGLLVLLFRRRGVPLALWQAIRRRRQGPTGLS